MLRACLSRPSLLSPLAGRTVSGSVPIICCRSHRALSTVPESLARPPSASTDFNELRERSLLRHVIASSIENDPESVMGAMDVFWDTYFNGAGTQEWNIRGEALDAAVLKAKPGLVLELGTYCGYSAVRIGRLLPEGAKLVSIEIEPLFAAIASKVRKVNGRGREAVLERETAFNSFQLPRRLLFQPPSHLLTLPPPTLSPPPPPHLANSQVVEHAGLSDKVKVEIGSVKERLPMIRKKYGDRPVDTLMLDHEAQSWLPDVKVLEEAGALTKDTVVLCDWNLYPGANGADASGERMRYGQEFMDYLQKRDSGTKDLRTVRYNLKDKDVFTVSSWTGVV